jgi:hypothetical protein
MKVEIIKVDGKPVGWTITAEKLEDNNTLNSMRDLQFWGLDDTAIKYAGRIDESDSDNVKTLRWIQVKHANKKEE